MAPEDHSLPTLFRILIPAVLLLLLTVVGDDPFAFRRTFATTDDPYLTLQWGLYQIRAPAAWDLIQHPTVTGVAVIDTGVDADHEDLRDNVRIGFSYVNNSTDTRDYQGHGTMVSGVIAGVRGNGRGIAGVNPYARIVPYKIIQTYLTENWLMLFPLLREGEWSLLAQAITDAVQRGIRVINISQGTNNANCPESGPGNVDDSVRQAIRSAEQKGVVIVVSAGNNGACGNSVVYPAAYGLEFSNLVVVGASSRSAEPAWYTPNHDYISVLAPGGSGTGLINDDILTTVPNIDSFSSMYEPVAGTSLAAPHVSGVASLILSANPSLTAAQVKEIIQSTASLYPNKDGRRGYGIVNAEAAVKKALSLTGPTLDSVPPGGTWISPTVGQTLNTSVHFAAHAYDNSGGRGVNYVNFTAWWPALGSQSGPWAIICQLSSPSHDDVYECDWNFSGAPAGDILVSFDVYDNAGNRTLAPNGTRTIVLSPSGPGTPVPSTPTPTATPAPCQSTGSGVTLFADPSYGGSSCHTFDVGEYSSLAAYGLDRNVSSMRNPDAAYHVTLYDQENLTGRPGYWDADISQLPSDWDNQARSLRVERHDPCASGGTGVTLYAAANYSGACHTFDVGEYSSLSPWGLDRNVSSLRDPSGSYHVTLFDQENLVGTPGYFDSDTPQLTGYWNDRARSLRVEKHGNTACNPGANGVILYRDRDYSPSGGCIFITSGNDIADLTPLTFDHAISSIRFVGSYIANYQVLVYSQTNYQSLCGSYWQDQSDLLSCAAQSMSVRIVPFTAPTPIPTQPGTVFAGNVAPQAALDHSGATAATDGSLDTEWVGGHGVGLGLSWSQPVAIHRIVVWDRKASSDANGINSILIGFSDNTSIQAIDMGVLGPRCANVTFPEKTVTWVSVLPADAAGNNGFSEIEVWASTGPQYSNNNCVNKSTRTPADGAVTPPSVTATPAAGVTTTPTPTPLPATTCDGNTIALWPLTEGSGTVAHDICNGHDGSVSNGSWVADQAGTFALYFNGTNTTVSVPDSGAFNLPSFTVEAFVYRDTGGSGHGNRQQLVRRGQVGGGGDQFILGFGEDYLEVSAYCYGFQGTTAVGGGYHVPINGWNHVALTFDGSTLKTYVNGSLDKAMPYPSPSCPSTSAGSGPLVIGNNRVDSDYYVGRVQYVRLSNTARTSFPNPQATPTGATKNFGIYADGTSVLAATSGNVGIGTTGPSSQLHVYNPYGAFVTIEDGGGGGAYPPQDQTPGDPPVLPGPSLHPRAPHHADAGDLSDAEAVGRHRRGGQQ